MSNNKKEITITRIFDVPRMLMWKAWTDPKTLKQWWGPKDFTSSVAKMDVRVGGKYLTNMISPDGEEFWSTGVYRDVIPLELLVITDSFADKEGNVVPATIYGFDKSFPEELNIKVTFKEHQEKTELTLIHSGLNNISEKDKNDMKEGWSQSLDKLEKYVTKCVDKNKKKFTLGDKIKSYKSKHP